MNRKILLATAALITVLGAVPAERNIPPVWGKYYFGDGLGVNCTLWLNKGGSFRWEWRGCLGVYGKNHGRVRVESDVVLLYPDLPNKEHSFGGMDTRLVPVPWGQQLYLVPEDQIISFCNAVNQRTPRNDDWRPNFYLRVTDATKPATGMPLVPAKFEKYLLPRPLHGKILSINGDRAVINLGSNQGVLPEMEFHAFGSTKRWSQLTVLSVEADRSTAKAETMVDPVIVGDFVSSMLEPPPDF